MGWNTGYTIFEETVVGAYNLGLLSKDLLSVLMEPYRDTDIDSGGSMDLTSKDGLGVKEIVIKTWGLELPEEPDVPDNYKERTKEQQKAWDDYCDARYNQFRSVTKEFGWW
jgi:hypothetical protein